MSNLLKDCKDVIAYWDYEKNKDIILDKVTVGNQNSFFGNVQFVIMNGKLGFVI